MSARVAVGVAVVLVFVALLYVLRSGPSNAPDRPYSTPSYQQR